MGFRDWLTDHIVRFLTKPVAGYDLRGPNDFERLQRHIRKGDVLLVEGDQRVSAVINSAPRTRIRPPTASTTACPR